MANQQETALSVAREADAATEQPPQYGRGFDGMATEPFPEPVRRILAEPVNPDDVEIKPDGIVFLPGVAWRRILTRAFGAGGWAIQPRGPARVMDNLVIYPGALWALGRFVSEATGECFYRAGNSNMSYASCVEGAKTDALSRCCKDLGHGAEMWDANWREEWKAKYAVSYQGDKWDAKTNGYKKATLWKLKQRVSNPHDLMAGAGGVAPAATAPASASPSRSAPAASGAPAPAPTAAAPVSTPTASRDRPKADAPTAAPNPIATAPASSAASTDPGSDFTPDPGFVEFVDDGVAASEEQKLSLKSELKRLQWKWGFMRDWFNAHFGILGENAMRTLDSLTETQADDAYLLLSSHGKPLYDAVLAELRAKGSVK